MAPRSATAAVLAYSACSVCMTLLNKAAAVLPAWRGLRALPIVLQSVSVLSIEAAAGRGRLSLPTAREAAAHAPAAACFVCMLLTSFLALRGLSVPFVAVGKNMSTVLTATLEVAVLGRRSSLTEGASLVAMVAAAVLAGRNDLAFEPAKYLWLAANCVSTSAYVLFLRARRGRLAAKHAVVLNNVAVLLALVPVALWTGELDGLSPTALLSPAGVGLIASSGACAFALSYAAVRCVAATSATTFAVAGAANKVPSAVIGHLLWHTPISAHGGASIALGTCCTLAYALSRPAGGAVVSGTISGAKRNKGE